MKYLISKVAYFWFVFMLIFVGLFVRVKATEIQNWSSNQTRLTLDDHGSLEMTSLQNTPYTFENLSLPVLRVQFKVRASGGLSTENTYSFTFGYKPTPDNLSWNRVQMQKGSTNDYHEDNYTCSTPYVNSYGYYLTDCTLKPKYQYSNTEDLWVTIFLTSSQYQTSIRTYMSGFDERLGTNAVITDSANQIINNQNENTTNIINNNNQNTQAIIDSNTTCLSSRIDKSSIYTDNYYLLSDGTTTYNASWGITDYIHFEGNIKKLNTSGISAAICFYKEDKTLISCSTNVSVNIGIVNVPNNSYYFRASINKNEDKPQYDIKECKNSGQAISDTLEDDEVEDPDEMISEMEDLLPENGVITQLIALPVTLYTKVLNNINGTCSSQNLGSLYGTNLIIPCIDVDDYLGSTLWNTIDILISGFFVYVIAKKMIKVFNNFTSMKEGDVIGD